MKISVVLCTYNGTRFLEKQLDSLKNQTVPLDEVIVCDDRSTDGTPDMIREYVKKHGLSGWQIHVNEVNKGYKRNFHDAVAMATGDWIVFADQDDIWHADKLERMLKVAAQHPDAQAIGGSFDLIDGFDRPIPHDNPPGQANHGMIHRELMPGEVYYFRQEDRNTVSLMGGNIALGCTLIISRRLADIYVRASEMQIPHDWEAVLWAYFMDGLYFMNEPVILYRLHGKNTIGLPIGSQSDPDKAPQAPQKPVRRVPSLEGRIDVMQHYEASMRCTEGILKELKLPPLPARFERYGRVRMQMLKERSLLKYLLMLRDWPVYRDMFTFRQRVGDLMVLMRRKG